MALKLNVTGLFHVVVPVRFDRACRGKPQREAPDLDDRGFEMGARQPGSAKSDARGAMLGLTLGGTARVRVLREDLDEAAKLYVTSSAPEIVEVVSPAAGSELPADGIVEVKALKDSTDPVKVQVRFGKTDGPVISELEPHVFKQRKLRVRVHMVSINGTAPARTAASIAGLLRQVNDIWWPCGIHFELVDTVVDAIPGFTTPGTVTTDVTGALGPWQVNEFSQLIQLSPLAAAINVYCVQKANDPQGWLGLTYSNKVARPLGYGVAIVDAASPTDLAHELGHFLTLHHTKGDADTWSLRRLMTAGWPPPAPSFKHDVGYGPGQYGAFITLKDLPGDPEDAERARAANHAKNPY